MTRAGQLDGRRVLAEIKTDDDLKSIPVVVLTTSAAEEDILRSYDLHANAYVTKPVDFAKLQQLIKPFSCSRKLAGCYGTAGKINI